LPSGGEPSTWTTAYAHKKIWSAGPVYVTGPPKAFPGWWSSLNCDARMPTSCRLDSDPAADVGIALMGLPTCLDARYAAT